MTHIANDNSDDVATNLFKRVPVERSFSLDQKFRKRALDRFETFMNDPGQRNLNLLKGALEDHRAYRCDGEVHPLDQE